MRYAYEIVLLDREMQGCFCVNFGFARGTAFILFVGEQSVFVTAAHIMRGAVVGDNVYFLMSAGPNDHKLSYIAFHEHDDVCIFTCSDFAVGGIVPPPYPEPAILPGGATLFLGFPHGLFGGYPGQGWPTPLVRRASFSGAVTISDRILMVLDGFNNPGYSGGPVYTTSLGGETALVAVVSGYRYEAEAHSRLYQKDEHGIEEVVPDIYTKPNSGMTYATPIRSVVELLAECAGASNPRRPDA